MINGAHVLFYSTDADADRAFLRDVLGLPFVDVGHGWLIFGLPPAEAAVHPSDDDEEEPGGGAMIGAHVYLMTDDLDADMKRLTDKGVTFEKPSQEPWGRRTSFALPSGQAMGMYQPRHEVAYNLWKK